MFYKAYENYEFEEFKILEENNSISSDNSSENIKNNNIYKKTLMLKLMKIRKFIKILYHLKI